MMDRREQVKRALWHLEREPMPLRDPADEAARRHRIANAVNSRVRELVKEKRSEAFRRQTALLACAAAVALVAGALWFKNARTTAEGANSPVAAIEVAGAVSVVRDGHSRALDERAPRLSSTDVLRTATGASAHAVLASGAVVRVQASTSIRFEANRTGADGSEDLALEKGEIALKVPKLGPHRRLSIHTPDATVTVRGTEFTVGVRERAGRTVTGVKVVEGSVWVTNRGREITLEKGSEWSSDAESVVAPVAEPAAPTPGSTPAAEPSGAASQPTARAPGIGSGHDDPKSTLGAENDQYQQAVSAARAGDDRKAIGGFETFLRRYPASPLAQSAEVERFRALKRLGRTQDAARRAQQYLAAYPAGFARAEARALVGPAANDTGGP